MRPSAPGGTNGPRGERVLRVGRSEWLGCRLSAVGGPREGEISQPGCQQRPAPLSSLRLSLLALAEW